MRQRSAQVALALVCFFLGIMLVVQFRSQARIVKDTLALPSNEQVLVFTSLYKSNQELEKEVATLRNQLLEYESSLGASELNRMVADINRLRIVNGASEVSGPGIQVTIAGTLGPQGGLPPEELNDLVNELRDAGAEAIAVNGHRIVINSAFSRSGASTVLDGIHVVNAPYVIEAIGNAEGLERALNRPDGMVSFFEGKYTGAQVTVFRKPNLVLPKRERELGIQLAQAIEEAK